ncbi:NAD-dependent epimerase/dehydratase family protein [Candidatus Latescibacterota bacterium]
MIKNKKIFITGGAGFIGSKLTSKFSSDNTIVLFDNLSRNTIKHTSLLDNPNISLIQGDILDFSQVRSAMADADIVIHAAAIAGIDTVVKNPVLTMEVNMLGTANVLRAAHESNVSNRFIDFSTSEVFGSMAYRVKEDSHAVTGSAGEARWIYAVSKIAGEHLSFAYYRQYDLPIVTIRPFNIYGPGQTGEGAMHTFLVQALRNEDIFIYGDGTQIRAWCYVDDMVEGILLALEKPEAIGHSFNIGNSKAVMTIYGLAQTILRMLNSKSKIQFKEPLSADIELRIPETQKAYDILGFKAKVDIEEGILRTAEWYKKNQNLK